ncbi:MAG: hypothetical protein JSS27_05395 [Planctomycetes bacterium]|nr:hypothetical protein [Planctomycetota bacterium]
MYRSRLMMIGCWLAWGILIGVAGAQAPSKTPAPTAGPPTAKQVIVGMYLNQVDSVSLKDSQIVVDFHIWFRWKDADLKPIETFDVVNGKIELKEDIVTKDDVNGYRYACCRVLATIHKLWDVSRFPLDEHELLIEIEDGDFEEDKVRYIADVENSDLNPDVEVAGWNVGECPVSVITHRYNTNFGDTTLETGHGSNYSRFRFPVLLSRPSYGMFFKLLTGMFIASAIGLHALLIKPSELDARFALTVGAMFAAVASEYVVVSSLPEANYLTLADKLHILTFTFIFASMAVSVVSYKLAETRRLHLCRLIDSAAFITLGAAYIVTAYKLVV